MFVTNSFELLFPCILWFLFFRFEQKSPKLRRDWADEISPALAPHSASLTLSATASFARLNSTLLNSGASSRETYLPTVFRQPPS